MTREKMTRRMKGLGSFMRGLALACAALVGGAAVAAPAAPSYELSFWALMPGGSASGAGMHEAGKPVTLKATPEKGYVFSGWYEVHYGTAYRLESDVDFRTPTYSYMMPASNIVICAEFVSVTNDVAEISPMRGATVVSEAVCTPNIAIEPIVLDVVNCKSLPKVTVKGLPPGLKFTAKKLTTRDGSVLKANTVYGAPTKSGVYEMTATVTTATKKTATTTVTFVVADSAKGDRILRIAYDKESGKVSGAGVYAEGKKVTLKATPAKGYVFAGWYYDGEGRLEGEVDFRTPTYPYVMPTNDAALFAKFVPVGWDDAQLTVRIDGEEVSSHECKPKVAIPPVALNVYDCISLPTVKVTGLPAGLKFTAKELRNRDGSVLAKANTIYGTPTKSGVYATTVTVTTAGKKTATETVTFVVIDRTKEERVLKIVADASRGKATGAGVYAFDTKVTLKATPNKGFVFAGWYEDPSFTSPLSVGIDHRTPTFPYETGGADRSIFAKFVPVAEDKARLAVRVEDEEVAEIACAPKAEIGPIVLDVCDSSSLPTVTVKGLPAGLKFTAKRLVGRDGSVLAEANTIYGSAPAKSGVYEMVVTVRTAGKSTVERRFSVAVDNQTAANERLRVTDAASGELTALKNARGEKYTVYAGVAEHDLPAIVTGDAADKLTLSGLPAGLKFTAKELRNRDGSVLAEANTIYGVPTKAGTYTATATVRSGREAFVSTFTVEVVALPTWAVGTFVGTGDDYEIEPYELSKGNLHWTFTVSSNGKVSGKVHFDTNEGRLLTATFSKPSFKRFWKDIGKYRCDIDLVFKDKGKVVKEETRRLYVSAEPYEDFVSKEEDAKEEEMDGRLTVGYAQLFSMPDEEFRNYALQNVWKRKSFEALPQFAARKTSVTWTSGTATLTLDLAPKGVVNATLALMDGGKVKTFAAKGDLIVWNYEVLDDGKYWNPVYLADVNLVFKDRLLHAEIKMKVADDGKVYAEGCEIESVDRFADEEAEEEPEAGE